MGGAYSSHDEHPCLQLQLLEVFESQARPHGPHQPAWLGTGEASCNDVGRNSSRDDSEDRRPAAGETGVDRAGRQQPIAQRKKLLTSLSQHVFEAISQSQRPVWSDGPTTQKSRES